MILCTNSQTLYTEGLERLRRRLDRGTLSNVPRSGYIAARDQSKVESDVT